MFEKYKPCSIKEIKELLTDFFPAESLTVDIPNLRVIYTDPAKRVVFIELKERDNVHRWLRHWSIVLPNPQYAQSFNSTTNPYETFYTISEFINERLYWNRITRTFLDKKYFGKTD